MLLLLLQGKREVRVFVFLNWKRVAPAARDCGWFVSCEEETQRVFMYEEGGARVLIIL